jgi:S1-C subfamily serine protease
VADRRLAVEVVVKGVAPGTQAGRPGLKKGDVLLEFDGERIDSASQFTALLRARRERGPLRVRRDGQTLTVTVARQLLGVTLDDRPRPPKTQP